MDWLLKRSNEASTYGGLAAIIYGIGDILKIKEAPAIGEAVTAGGQAYVSSGDWVSGAVIAGLGLLAAFKSDGSKGF